MTDTTSRTQTPSSPASAAGVSSSRPKRKRARGPKDGPDLKGGSAEARQRAAVLLEVLAGVLLPSEAAEVLGCSLPSYFHLERRALEGLIQGCETPSRGRKATLPEKKVEELEKKLKRLEQESARYQALARIAQRNAGGLSASQLSKVKTSTSSSRKRKRRPAVRALKVARTLKKQDAVPAAPAGDSASGNP